MIVNLSEVSPPCPTYVQGNQRGRADEHSHHHSHGNLGIFHPSTHNRLDSVVALTFYASLTQPYQPLRMANRASTQENVRSQAATIRALQEKLQSQSDNWKELSALYVSRHERLEKRLSTCFTFDCSPPDCYPGRWTWGRSCHCKFPSSHGGGHVEATFGRWVPLSISTIRNWSFTEMSTKANSRTSNRSKGWRSTTNVSHLFFIFVQLLIYIDDRSYSREGRFVERRGRAHEHNRQVEDASA